ncbi:unnamed protein product [Dibothriocephalus latus]|uniref:FZ domain-containing protein n=1 Tax=Dibothriocephalus latus TaxID=60516 RepID=A0A3P7PS51_DIBLA|nr:unnamed protein product [Dibothriocephalus latus]
MGSRLCIILLTVFAFTIHAFPPEAYGPIGQRRCFQPVRIEIPECQNTFYNFTGLPNLVGQESQVDARHQLQTFKPLITYKCSNQLAFFLCSVYAPMCDVNTHHLIGPCRPLCERVRKRCSPVLRIFDFDWPANLNCSRFPERNTVGGAMCMEGPEAGEDEEDADTPTVDVSAHGSSEGEVSKAEWPQKPSAAGTSHTGRGELAEERGIIPAEGIIRQIEDLPEAANMDLSKLGPQLQNWLASLNQNPLSTFFGNNEIPVALLVSSLRFCSHLYKPTSYIFINRTGRCAPHCSADILFSQNAKTLATVWTSVISGLCLLATTCALLSYAIHPSLFYPLERPVIYIAGCQLAYALGFALRLKLGREAVACGVDPASGYSIRLQEGLENSNCALVFLIQYYFFVAGAIWWAMMVIGWTRRTSYAYRLMRNPSRDSASAYVPPKSPCCCLGGSTRGETPFVFEEAGAFMDATTCALLSYAVQPSLFHPLERPVIYIAGCQLAYALGFALRLKLGREVVACGVDPASGYSIRLQEGLENSNCALVFLIQYYFFIAGAIWWAMMVIGWTRRTSYAYRLMHNPCRDSASAYVPPKSPCCCLGRSTLGETPSVFGEAGAYMDAKSGAEANRSHGPPSGVNPAAVGPSGGAQPATTSSLRASHVNRRIQTASSNSIDLNCLAKEHVIAWLTPGLLTVAVLVTRQVSSAYAHAHLLIYI